ERVVQVPVARAPLELCERSNDRAHTTSAAGSDAAMRNLLDLGDPPPVDRCVQRVELPRRVGKVEGGDLCDILVGAADRNKTIKIQVVHCRTKPTVSHAAGSFAGRSTGGGGQFFPNAREFLRERGNLFRGPFEVSRPSQRLESGGDALHREGPDTAGRSL